MTKIHNCKKDGTLKINKRERRLFQHFIIILTGRNDDKSIRKKILKV